MTGDIASTTGPDQRAEAAYAGCPVFDFDPLVPDHVDLLLEDGERWEQVCADPGLISNAVEETLRVPGLRLRAQALPHHPGAGGRQGEAGRLSD